VIWAVYNKMNLQGL